MRFPPELATRAITHTILENSRNQESMNFTESLFSSIAELLLKYGRVNVRILCFCFVCLFAFSFGGGRGGWSSLFQTFNEKNEAR